MFIPIRHGPYHHDPYIIRNPIDPNSIISNAGNNSGHMCSMERSVCHYIIITIEPVVKIVIIIFYNFIAIIFRSFFPSFSFSYFPKQVVNDLLIGDIIIFILATNTQHSLLNTIRFRIG
ncbi:MAG: hypothetical protein AUG74_22260 [Bacteroidetes bacterium 13_1_20CM_4_60_6]|nr:MAG: hypothetical protein AUG74_22260 [Bacteroidetes bacterium 13_1_20CM_4_60_6]